MIEGINNCVVTVPDNILYDHGISLLARDVCNESQALLTHIHIEY